MTLSAANGTPSCSGILDVEEDINNGGKIKIVGCTQGSATVKLLKDTYGTGKLHRNRAWKSASLLPTPWTPECWRIDHPQGRHQHC